MNKTKNLTIALTACLLASTQAHAQTPAVSIKLYSYQGDIRPYVQQCTDQNGAQKACFGTRRNITAPSFREAFLKPQGEKWG